jgi:hypothetical protein
VNIKHAVIAALALIVVVVPSAHAQSPAAPAGPRIAVVIRVDGPPLLGPDGAPSSVARGVVENMSGPLRALAGAAAPIALSVSPLFIDELRVSGPSSVYSALVAAAEHNPLLLQPYAHAVLPQEAAAAVVQELRHGASSLRDDLRAGPEPVLDPPTGALTENALRAAHGAGVVASLAPAAVVGGGPVITAGVTLVPSSDLVGTDPRALAGEFGPRASLVLVGGADARSLTALGALAHDARVTIVPIGELLAGARAEDVRFDEVTPPPSAYSAAVARAAVAARQLGSYTLPGNAVDRLSSLLLARAQSTADWQRRWDAGIAYADRVVDIARREQRRIRASDGAVTLTSRRGAVPVSLENTTGYPVRLRVRVTSPKLVFPSGDQRTVTVSPHGVTVTFVAEARSTGSFPMDVILTSPDGAVRFAGGRVFVRSTAANVLALVLTVSGLLFLVVWSSRDLIRRSLRRSR